MRILYVHRSLADGGEGVHIRSMIRAFRERGHRVRVLGPGGSELGDPAAVTSRTRASSLLARLPGAVVEIGELLYGKLDALRARRVAARFRPDLVYARHGAFTTAPLAAGGAAGAPVFLEVNSPLTLERSGDEGRPLRFRGVARRLERRCLEGADRLLVVSSPLGDYLRREFDVATPITVLPNGIDPGEFRELPDGSSVRARLGIGEDVVVVGFVGFIRSWHGLDLLFRAAGSAAAELAGDVELAVLVVGGGPALAEMRRRAPSEAAPARVVFSGRVPHAEIPDHLAAIDVAVSPGTTFYACPLKLIEYLAAGRAVVAPHTGNILDVLRPGVDGLTFAPDDQVDLAASLVRLASDAELRDRLGRTARERTLEERSWDRNAAIVEELAEESPTW